MREKDRKKEREKEREREREREREEGRALRPAGSARQQRTKHNAI
jgi:hypothetical protein